jgi:hypothetical protein
MGGPAVTHPGPRPCGGSRVTPPSTRHDSESGFRPGFDAKGQVRASSIRARSGLTQGKTIHVGDATACLGGGTVGAQRGQEEPQIAKTSRTTVTPETVHDQGLRPFRQVRPRMGDRSHIRRSEVQVLPAPPPLTCYLATSSRPRMARIDGFANGLPTSEREGRSAALSAAGGHGEGRVRLDRSPWR